MTTIAHPTNATGEDNVAFEHATALAQRANARLVSVHAGADPEFASQIPDAETLVSRWAGRSVQHEKVIHNCCIDDPSEGVLNALKELAPDLVVAATHRRGAVARIFSESYAEAIAGNVKVPSLLIPAGARGFVNSKSGVLDLHQILVPIGDVEEATAAVEKAAWMLEIAGIEQVEIVLLRVGGSPPEVALPEHDGWTWTWKNSEGSLEDAVERESADACVIVMATRGHNSFGDVVVGSHTERVLRRASCPVLSVPVA